MCELQSSQRGVVSDDVDRFAGRSMDPGEVYDLAEQRLDEVFRRTALAVADTSESLV